jgi:hypothetical protein
LSISDGDIVNESPENRTADRRRQSLGRGKSIRSTVRLTAVAKNTVTKLLIELGAAVAEYQDRTIRNLSSRRIQCDEIWSFVGAKERQIKKDPSRRRGPLRRSRR